MSTFEVAEPHAQVALTGSSSDSSYQVSLKRGTESGVGVSVSGAGAWAELKGTMTFQIQSLETSSTYQEMKSSYDIGGGIGGFWSWLISASAQTHKEQIEEAFHEVQQSQAVSGKAHYDLQATGLIPNAEVTATAYVLVLQVTDSSGNTYNMASSGDPAGDTGAQDQNGNALPTKNNTSTITL